MAPLNPQEKGFRLAVLGLNGLYASGMRMPARGAAAFSAARRLVSASIIRCRFAHLVEVQTNHRLSKHSSMRRASAMPHSGSSLPPNVTSLAPHDSKARLRHVTTRRDSWRSHVHRTRLRSACSSSSYNPAMSGVEGNSPRVLLGDLKGAILSRERMAPFIRAPARCRDRSSAAALRIFRR